MKIAFLDLVRQRRNIEPEIEKAVRKVLQRSNFILGEEVAAFEKEFCAYCGVKFGVGLNSGTDALFLSLMALGIGPGDEVIVPAFTFIATANAVSYTGAKPVFVDIDAATYNIDPIKIEKAITRKTRAIIPVHLFGQCADMSSIMRIAEQRGLKVIEDACQAHGAVWLEGRKPRKAGSMGDAGCFSFYPTKNLGGMGDGGMVVTDSERIYEKLLLLRDCGRVSRYEHAIVGYNSRLDTIQAAGLRVKLKYLERWNAMRKYNAELYDRLLESLEGVVRPKCSVRSSHVYHIYGVLVKNRDKVMQAFKEHGIGFMVNYPLPLHLQPAYRSLGYRKGDFPAAEAVSKRIISLPMHPTLARKEIEEVVRVLRKSTED